MNEVLIKKLSVREIENAYQLFSLEEMTVAVERLLELASEQEE